MAQASTHESNSVAQQDWVYRADRGLLLASNYKIDPQTGFLTCWAKIARAGVQVYQELHEDGITTRREYRPPSEVSRKESLEGFRKSACTSPHPPILLDRGNARYFAVGWAGDSILYRNGYVEAELMIIDGAIIDGIINGTCNQLSAGYRCKLLRESGVSPEGEVYDAVQTFIVPNHIAIVEKARGGDNLTFYPEIDNQRQSLENLWQRSDSDWDESYRFDDKQIVIGIPKNDFKCDSMNKKKKWMNWTRDEMSAMSKDDLIEAVLEMVGEMTSLDSEHKDALDSTQTLESKIKELQEKLDSKTGLDSNERQRFDKQIKERDIRLEDLTAKLDSAMSNVNKLEDKLRTETAKADRLDLDNKRLLSTRDEEIQNKSRQWIQAWTDAADFLPATLKKSPDVSLEPEDIYRLAIKSVQPEIKADEMSPEQVKGAFQMLQASGLKASSSDTRFRERVNNAKASFNTDASDQIISIREQQIKRTAEAWKLTN